MILVHSEGSEALSKSSLLILQMIKVKFRGSNDAQFNTLNCKRGKFGHLVILKSHVCNIL